MYLLYIFLSLPLLSSGQTCPSSISEINHKKVSCSGEVIFEDNFEKLDTNKWKHTVRLSGDDYDFVIYNKDAENIFIKDGKLVIKPTVLEDHFIKTGTVNLQGCTEKSKADCSFTAKAFSILPPVKSAQICTKESFSFKYGTITVSAKFPSGDWVIPQVWLKPKNEVYGGRYMSGKIRIASVRGNEDLVHSTGTQLGTKLLESGILVAKDTTTSPIRGRSVQLMYSEPWTLKSHNYTLVWKSDDIYFYVDGRTNIARSVIAAGTNKLIPTLGFAFTDNTLWAKGSKIAPFDQEFYICLGVSVGGNHGFPDETRSKGKPKPWKNLSVKDRSDFLLAKSTWLPTWSEQTQMEVDHILVTSV